MRILLCLNRDLMSNLALNLLLVALQNHQIFIILSNGIGKKPRHELLQFLERDLINDCEFPLIDGEKNTALTKYKTFNQAADFLQTSIMEFPNINDAVGVEYVKSLNLDLIVSIRFGQIFQSPIITLPRLGIINLHSGILPDYRGVLATFWALLNGEENIGCTLHYITDNTIDTGPIIGIHRLPADTKKTLLCHTASLYKGGCEMVCDTILKLSLNNSIPTTLQLTTEGAYYSYPSHTDISAFLSKGYKLFSSDEYLDLLQKY